MKPLKIFTLPLECCITWKPLATKKLFIVRVIKFFNFSVSPWFTGWDKHRLHTKMQAKPDNQTKGSGVFITTAKAQLVVQLQKIGKPYGLPAPQQAVGNLLILFAAL
jgi:hypothetical protein